ncbi:MAG: hypothetical protein AAGI23_08200 [Bacteroidota bacterium]
MIKVLLLASLLSYSTDSLPDLSILHASIESYYQAQTEAELIEYQENAKGDWLKYLPSVGVNYALVARGDGFATAPRPTVSYNTGKLLTMQNEKKKRASKRRTIVEQLRLKMNEEKRNVTALYEKYYIALESMALEDEILEIEKKLFGIAEAEYERDLKPSVFLPKKKAFLKYQQSVIQRKSSLRTLRIEVLELARVGNIK